MSLDLTKVATQVDGMLSSLKADLGKRRTNIHRALETARGQTDLSKLKEKIARSTWPIADPVEALDSHHPPPPIPADFTVMAADGSHIDVDRHRATRCYLLNISSVVLRYGADPDAILASSPHLYAADDELAIVPDTAEDRPQWVEGALLGIKRSVEECRQLAALAAESSPGSSSLALLDGTLVLWGLYQYPGFIAESMLDKGLLVSLGQMQQLNKDRKLALASYISYPRSTDVIDILRIARCPFDRPDCDHCPSGKPVPPDRKECETVAGVLDRDLFSSLLSPGERSGLFKSQSSVMRRYGDHMVYFFYINVEDEIARVEVPQWVAQDNDLLDLTHSLTVDQCRRGQGYPVALSEAHEQAVVTMADRENFWALVEASLVEDKLPYSDSGSGKSRSKRMKGV